MRLFAVIIGINLLICRSIKPLTAQNMDAIDHIMAGYNDDRPGASVLLIDNGQVRLQRQFGYANLETYERVSPATNFRLASVSKQFTATCILQLIAAGKLSFQTTLLDVFPDFPPYGEAITVEHLLTHTSGIPDYEDYVADTAFNPQIKDEGVLEILKTLNEGYFAPGTQFRYSNSAYALLALIVEKYSEMPYPKYLQKHIFEPLGMKNTVAHVAGKTTVSNRALGYGYKGTWKLHDQSSTSAVLGDGGIYSNVLDLYRWSEALYAGNVLPLSLIRKSFDRYRLEDGRKVDYGYGWHLKTDDKGREVVYHTGSSMSFRNIFYRIPSLGISIIVLTNRNQPSEAEMVPLAEAILEAAGY